MYRSQRAASVILLAAVVLGAWPMYQELNSAWMDQYGAMSHGYLVLAITLWFGVRAWRAPPPLPVSRPAWWVAPILVGLVLCSYVAEQLFFGGIRTALLPLQFVAAIATCLGFPAARRLAGPATFLYFGLPVWGPLNGVLQWLTVRVAQFLIHLVGVPAYVEGNYVQLPEGTFQIASGCSGLSFFIVALTLGTFACTLHVHQWRHRCKLMVAALLAGLIANWLRVSSVIVIGYLTDMQSYLIRVDHLLYGWVLFIVVMLPVFWLTRRYTDAEQARASAATSGNPGLAPVQGNVWPAVALCAAILLLPMISLKTGTGPEQSSTSQSFPSGWQPKFVGARETLQELPNSVEVYRASYTPQSRAARISLPENTVTGHEWRAAGSSVIPVSLASGSLDVVEYRGFLRGRERLVWAWYDVAGIRASTKVGYRVAEIQGLLRGRHDASITAISSNCLGNCMKTRSSLQVALDTLLKTPALPTASQFAKP